MKVPKLNFSSHDVLGGRLSPEERMTMAVVRANIFKAQTTLQPIFLILVYAGFVLATLTIARRNIRRYSSAVYLYVLLAYDLLLACSHFLPTTMTELDSTLDLTDESCILLNTLKLFSRVGGLLITVVLPLERIIVITNPRRCQFIATPKTALLVSGVSAAVGLALSGVNMRNYVWAKGIRLCLYRDDAEKNQRQNLSTTTTFSVVFICLAMQLMNSVWLGILLMRKRSSRNLDPIQNSINTAKQHTNQLNRINLIAFLMALLSFLSNLPQNINLLLFWAKIFDKQSAIFTIVWYSASRIFSMCMLAIKAYVVGAASPKIRRELWLALKCTKENSSLTSRGIEINPEKFRQKEAATAISSTDCPFTVATHNSSPLDFSTDNHGGYSNDSITELD